MNCGGEFVMEGGTRGASTSPGTATRSCYF